MASTSEKTFGSRLQNAEKVLTNLTAFSGYNPPTAEQSISNYETLITTIKTQNNEAASKIQAYSAAVDNRQKLFQKNSDSLNKIMTPIAAAIRSSYGKTSKEATDIAAMVTKVRGLNVKKDTKDPNATTVSQSERSYGSMTQTFADMIATLENYGANYNAANSDVKQ
jgi:DNA topoisomerase VI subunit B